MTIKTFKTELKPNSHMLKILKQLCDYRRYCFNQALATWQDMYSASLINPKDNKKPSGYKVRNELVSNKADWQYSLSARVLQQSVDDLTKAMKMAIKNTDWGFPKFKSKHDIKQSFKTDRLRLKDNKHVILDKPRGVHLLWFPIEISEKMPCKQSQIKLSSITFDGYRYTLAISYKTGIAYLPKTNQKNAVDVNVGHFNDVEGSYNILPKKVRYFYKKIKYYQKCLAKKRCNNTRYKSSNSYDVTKAKLHRCYKKVNNIQHDLLSKYTTSLVRHYDQLVIEDLDVKHMQMSHVASKGLQRSLFGEFRRQLTYKCEWYGKELILANRFYPSTQRCSQCGYIKTGDEKITLSGNKKHHTNHNQYICYQCGSILNRDMNAVNNLLQLI